MTGLEIVLTILLVAVSTGLGFSLWMASKLSALVYELEDQVEESLDILDSSYKSIGKVLETPVFYDDPVVKQTLASLKAAHNAILLVANKITTFSNKGQGEEEGKA